MVNSVTKLLSLMREWNSFVEFTGVDSSNCIDEVQSYATSFALQVSDAVRELEGADNCETDLTICKDLLKDYLPRFFGRTTFKFDRYVLRSVEAAEENLGRIIPLPHYLSREEIDDLRASFEELLVLADGLEKYSNYLFRILNIEVKRGLELVVDIEPESLNYIALHEVLFKVMGIFTMLLMLLSEQQEDSAKREGLFNLWKRFARQCVAWGADVSASAVGEILAGTIESLIP
ncbi:hypothetical protein [Boudabousia liubingyangii]|uniref:hypothetical protein n=1 Tax=Boudabousia liubingyangii TaxID=1921764 RepID=UPI00093E10FB|nr:hypothetical protein [Boudabousia liubingyangii]